MTEPTPLGRGELRAVLDTNVPIAAHLSRNPRSPTIELLARWRTAEFTQLYSDDMLLELVEKFQARRIALEASDLYLADVITLGEHVSSAYALPLLTAHGSLLTDLLLAQLPPQNLPDHALGQF